MLVLIRRVDRGRKVEGMNSCERRSETFFMRMKRDFSAEKTSRCTAVCLSLPTRDFYTPS